VGSTKPKKATKVAPKCVDIFIGRSDTHSSGAAIDGLHGRTGEKLWQDVTSYIEAADSPPSN
jgi:hypothetical protein